MAFAAAVPLIIAAVGAAAQVKSSVDQGDALSAQAKASKKAQDDAVANASALVQKQKADRENTMKLGDAFSSLSSYQARSAGSGSTQFTGKLGLSGGGSY